MTFDARPHVETLEAMLTGLAGRLEAPRSVSVVVDAAGNVELEVIGSAGAELEALLHTVHAEALRTSAGPEPLVAGYDRLAARIDAAIPKVELTGGF